MGIFKKNPNEKNYVGGKKHWVDVIKNSGPGELLVWRQPEEDFNTNSTLIVMPGEEAIFVKGGNVEEIFEEGTYKLSTENYPVISRLRNVASGGISAFNCVVYFVRLASTMEMYWGTDTPIQVRDPMLGIATSVQARGAYKVKVDNSVVFMRKLLGNNINIAQQEDLYNYFLAQFQMHIKSTVAKYIRSSNQEVLGICAAQDELAAAVEPTIAEIVGEYGLKLLSFSIMGLDVPQDDPNRKMLEDAFAERATLNILGDDWGKVQARDILTNMSMNPGTGEFGAMAGGIGMGVAAGSVIGTMANQMFTPMSGSLNQQAAQQNNGNNTSTGSRFVQRGQQPQQTYQQQPSQPQQTYQQQPQQNAPSGAAVCSACGQPLVAGAKFCMSCGTPVQAEAPKKLFCPNCGTELPVGAAFCGNCGTKLN